MKKLVVDDIELVRMCVELLQTLVLNNYIGQCTQLCPDNVSRLFNDVSTSEKLQSTVSEIVRLRLNTLVYNSWLAFLFAESQISSHVSVYSLTVRSCVYWMNEFVKIDKSLSIFFLSVAVLHVACKIVRNGFSDKLMDILLTILGPNFNQWHSVLSLHLTELNTSELVELLQKSAVEHLTTYRQLEARDFGSVDTIVTTDFEALYAYKHGDDQRCLQLSTQNVHMVWYGRRMTNIPTFPEFIQLLDDDIVSLIALTLIVSPKCRNDCRFSRISQLTLSLYLTTQCQLKLRHSVTSLTQTLEYIKVAHRRHPCKRTLD